MSNEIDRVDEKLTHIAVNCGCATPPDIRQFVSDLYRALTADDNLEVIQAVSRTGVNTPKALLRNARDVQRELSVDNARRAEVRKKAEEEAKKAKPKAKGKAAENAEDAPA